MADFGRIDFDDLQWERRRYSPNRSYAQSKLADLYPQQLAAVARERGWTLLSTAAHPGFTRTNLQSARRGLGGGTPWWSLIGSASAIAPSQGVETGAEPLLFAAADPAAANGAYYGPGGRFGLVGPTGPARSRAPAGTSRSTPACGTRPSGSPVRGWRRSSRSDPTGLTGLTAPTSVAARDTLRTRAGHADTSPWTHQGEAPHARDERPGPADPAVGPPAAAACPARHPLPGAWLHRRPERGRRRSACPSCPAG